ncbi:MAG: sodium:solute symporter family transporter [Bacillota bacterium]
MLYFVAGLYFALLLAIGFLTARKTKTISDFFLGNRTVGPWISAFAYGTTYFSAVLFIGYAGGQGWSFGLPVLWIALGNAFLGCLVPWLLLGPRTRRLTAEMGVMTMPEFLEARYGSRALKIVSALVIFIFLIPYSAAAYTGLSYLFQAVFGLDYLRVLMTMAAFTAFYLVLGGYFAVTLTDFVQGLIMLLGAVLMVGYVLRAPAVGGLGGFFSGLGRIDPQLVKIIPRSWPQILWLVLLTSLGTWGMPQMVQKFYAIKDEGAIRRAAIVGTIFCLVIAGAAYFIGASSPLFGPRLVAENEALFAASPGFEAAKTDATAARALIGAAMAADRYKNTMIVPQILRLVLPRFLLLVVLVLVLSATMSTVSSLVLVASSAITIDLVAGALWPRIGRQAKMHLMRLLCVAFIGLSVYLSWRGPSFLVALMSYSWGTIAGAFLGPYVLGLFWPRVSKAAVWTGLLAGLGVSLFSCLGANLGLFGVTKAQAPMYGSLAMLASVAVVSLVTLVTAPQKETVPAVSPAAAAEE